MSTRSIIDRSSALFFLTSAINVAALIGGGVLFARGAAGGSFDLLRAGLPIAGALVASLAVLAIPYILAHSPQRAWPNWLVDLATASTARVARCGGQAGACWAPSATSASTSRHWVDIRRGWPARSRSRRSSWAI